MNADIELVPPAPEALAELERFFGSQGAVKNSSLSAKEIVPEFRQEELPPDEGGEDSASEAMGVLGGVCGIRSGERILCALVVRTKEMLDAFRRDNGPLLSTLVTSWQDSLVLWFWVKEPLMTSLVGNGMFFHSSGQVPIVAATEPLKPRIARQAVIQEVDFKTFLWPPEIANDIQVIRTKQEMGPPFLRSGRRTVLNVNFWAAFLCARYAIAYAPATRTFTMQLEGQAMPPCNEAVFQQMVGVFLQNAATNMAATFPQAEIYPQRIARLAQRIKMLCGRPILEEGEVLKSFLRQHVYPAPGKQVAASKLHQAYLEYIETIHEPAMPKRDFFRGIKAAIRTQYSLGHSHDISLGGKRVRGYRGLALSEPTLAVSSDASDPSGGARKPT